LRYYLLREVPYGENARISLDGLARRYKGDLATDLAGLSQRVHTMLARYCEGRIPGRSVWSDFDQTIEIAVADIRAEARFLFDSYDFTAGLEKIWSLFATIGRFLTDNTARELADDPSAKRRLTDALFDASQGLGWIALLLHPVIPRATETIWKGLGQTTRLEDQFIDDTPWQCLMSGTPIATLEELFPPLGKTDNRGSCLNEQSRTLKAVSAKRS
jgi:methionyl-tRNA synthetase